MSKKLLTAFAVSLLTSFLSLGSTVYDSGAVALTPSDPIQLGRLSRSGVPSDWSSQKAFPGVLNPNTSYRYTTLVIPTSPFPYLQISVDDLSGSGILFASAYLNSYRPNAAAANRGLDVNYLGDEGSSGNPFGNPSAFQVILNSPESNHLVVVLNDANGTTPGLNQDIRILVEGFYDSNFSETPEPSTFALAGLAAAAGLFLRRRLRVQA